LAVRDRDALADRRRGEPLPVDEDLEQRIARDAVVMRGEMVGELGEEGELRLGLEVRQDQVLSDEVDDLHDVAGAHTTTSTTGYKCPWFPREGASGLLGREPRLDEPVFSVVALVDHHHMTRLAVPKHQERLADEVELHERLVDAESSRRDVLGMQN